MTKKIIYADNAATTQMSQVALDSMIRYLSTDYGNASQPYSFSRSSKKALKEARAIIADCIGAEPEEIFFTSGGSESDNWIIKNAWLNGQDIITTEIEHYAILNACEFVVKQNNKVSYLPVYDNGLICPDNMKLALSQGCLMSVMMANNEIGTIEPIHQYGIMAREKSATIHTDAVQAMGHIDINVKQLDVDFLSASGHKFNGPKGVGFLYARNGAKLQPLICGGAQEYGLRAGTENIASIMAMAIALRENVENLDKNKHHLYELEENLLNKLQNSSVSFARNGTNQLPGLISLSF
jgi:Cysteine sulfinate desulfinase/cysteine desulfurase and related enzymes